MNKGDHFEDLRVYGLLTDLTTFQFYSYDPIKKAFAFDEVLLVSAQRDMFIRNMIRGMLYSQIIPN